MTAKVIQGSFGGGGPRLPGPVAQPKAMPRPPGPPVPAFAGRPPVAQTKSVPRMQGPPAPAFAGRRPVVQRHGAGDAFAVDPGQLGLASSGGRPLPEAVRGKMEAALAADFSGVRVHVGPQAERIGAIAFTLGSDIYFAPGRFQPDTVHGQQLLGHELAHVVQQRQGRVRNPIGSGIAVVQDHALEADADRLGQRAAASTARPVPLPAGNLVIVLQNQRSRSNLVANDTRNIENRAHTNICVSQGKPRPVQRMHTIQRRPMHTAQITGVTHLREVQNKSLVHGSDYAEVKFPETVTIDKGDRWNSHLGINLSQTPSPNNLWYRVLSYRGNSISDREIYIRGEMIKDLGLSPEELLTRLAQPKTFQVPDKEIQKDIVARIESKSAQMPRNKQNGEIAENFLLGGIVLPVSSNIVQLIRDAKFVRLTKSMVNFNGQNITSNDEYLKKKIVQNMMSTLLHAGQLQYLARSGLTGGEWRVFVEIHYYRSRSKDVSSFHKDTVGRTLFVNLNYAIDHEIAGPEYVVNPLLSPEHEAQIASSLPPKFISDLKEARSQLKQPTEIGATKVPAYGVVSFVDELIHHMTPLYGPRTVYYQNVITFLGKKWGNDKYASAVALYKQFEASKDKLIFFASKTQEERVLINVMSQLESASKSSKLKYFNRKQLSDMGLPGALIDELIDTQSDERIGFRSAYISGVKLRTNIVDQGTPPLKRRMSQWALRGKIPPPVTGDRRFFRSNVQVIKATDLRNIVDKADLKKL